MNSECIKILGEISNKIAESELKDIKNSKLLFHVLKYVKTLKSDNIKIIIVFSIVTLVMSLILYFVLTKIIKKQKYLYNDNKKLTDIIYEQIIKSDDYGKQSNVQATPGESKIPVRKSNTFIKENEYRNKHIYHPFNFNY